MTKDGKPLTHSTKWDDISPQGQHYLLELECALVGSTLHPHHSLPVAQVLLWESAEKMSSWVLFPPGGAQRKYLRRNICSSMDSCLLHAAVSTGHGCLVGWLTPL